METHLSYASTPLTRPYDYKTTLDMVRHWAEQFPEKDAFVEYNMNGRREALTCKGLLEKSLKMAKYFNQTGLQKGDNVVFCMNNSLQMIVAIFGVGFAGGIPIFTSTNMADGSDVISLICEVDAALFIIDTNDTENCKIVENVSKSNSTLKKIICNGTKDIRKPNLSRFEFLSDVFQMDTGDNVVLPTIYPEDLAVYYKTSGSTGKPKLVGHAHFTWLNNTSRFNDTLGIDCHSKFFCDRPFSWLVGSPRTFLASGATRIFVDTRSTVEQGKIDKVCDIIAKEGCTHLYLPGYLITDILTRPDLKSKFTAVRSITNAGERFPKRYTQLLHGYCQQLCIWYGSTEAAGVSVFHSDDPDQYEDGIIGIPSPGVEMKLVDDHGYTVRKGESGELLTRSIYRFNEYRGMPIKFTEVVDTHNWFHTGDVGHIRSDGNFVLDGRRSEQISMGTMKFFPFDTEHILITCPGITSVVVVPVPDARLTNVICACVILDTNKQDLDGVKDFCNEVWVNEATASGLSQKPKHILVFEQFPINASGKLDRKGLAHEANVLLESE